MGEFKFYNQKKVLLSICKSLHSLTQYLFILQAFGNHPLNAKHKTRGFGKAVVRAFCLTRVIVAKPCLVHNHSAIWKQVQECLTCIGTTSSLGDWRERSMNSFLWELFSGRRVKMFIFHFIVFCIIQNTASTKNSILGGKTKKKSEEIKLHKTKQLWQEISY